MRRSARRLYTALALSGALACVASCKRSGGAAREDLALLPRDASIVVSLNVGRMRNTQVWRKILDLRDQSAEAKKKYDAFVAKCGLDPVTQLDSATLAFPTGGQAEGEFAAIVHGTFDEAKLVACAREEAQKQGHELVTVEYGGKKLYNDRDSGQLFAGLLDAHTVVAGGREWAKKVIDLAGGKAKGESVQDNEALRGLLGKVRTGDALWAVAQVPDSVRQKLSELRELDSSKSLKDVYGSVDFATGLALDATLDLGSEADAKDLATKLTSQLGETKKNSQVMMMGLASMIDAIKVTSNGPAFQVSVKYNQSQVDQIVERVQGYFKSMGLAMPDRYNFNPGAQ
jgi:hypothetical protein